MEAAAEALGLDLEELRITAQQEEFRPFWSFLRQRVSARLQLMRNTKSKAAEDPFDWESPSLAAVPASCTGDYNPLTLPGATPRDWRVYLLPVVEDGDRVPLGGAWRIDVHDGQVVAQRAFTQGCIALDNQGGDDAFVVSHLLDPIPTEIHVFWSLWADKPMFVTTSQGTWAISEGLIAPVPASPATTPTALDAIGTMGGRP